MQLIRCLSGGVRNAVMRLKYCGISLVGLLTHIFFNAQLRRRGRSGGYAGGL